MLTFGITQRGQAFFSQNWPQLLGLPYENLGRVSVSTQMYKRRHMEGSLENHGLRRGPEACEPPCMKQTISFEFATPKGGLLQQVELRGNFRYGEAISLVSHGDQRYWKGTGFTTNPDLQADHEPRGTSGAY
jgi:hypothetical protein